MVSKSSFVIDKKDVQPVEWQGGQMSHTRFYKTFTGDLAGTSVVEAMMMAGENDGASVYVGIERFECAVDGKAGTFILTHAATWPGREPATWLASPDTRRSCRSTNSSSPTSCPDRPCYS
jgi:hypothetical protein